MFDHIAENPFVYLVIVITVFSIVILALILIKNKQFKKEKNIRLHFLDKYQNIISVEKEVERLNKHKEGIKKNIDKLRTDFENRQLSYDDLEGINKEINLLHKEYKKKQIYFEKLADISSYVSERKEEKLKLDNEIEIVENKIEILRGDFDKKKLSYDDFEEIKKKINLLHEEYKKKQIFFEKLADISKYVSEREEERLKLDKEIRNIENQINTLRGDFEKKQISYDNLENIDRAILFQKDQRIVINDEIKELRHEYKIKKTTYDNLIKELSILEEDLEDLSFGIYKPHFEFDSAEDYKAKMIELKQMQRDAIRKKEAAKCYTNWQVNGSSREGTKMTNRNLKLMLRAFNGECDSAVLKVRWNNILNLEERINKSYELINKLGEPNSIAIENSYFQLRLDELRIAHEYREKKHEEREEQRRIHRQLREEQKVLREIDLAKKEAEKEEQKYIQLLAKAKQEVLKKHGFELVKYNERIKQLEIELSKAQELKERAISRAQITKSGHVYIISNLGAFGENVYKIGMTRRLEPFDRVYELSGASVPFSYDVHGMIYSLNAPKLETELHKRFDKKRVNRVNFRKEFFKVSLEEIENELKNIEGNIELIKIPEARQYRETVMLDSEEKKENIEKLIKKFPDEI